MLLLLRTRANFFCFLALKNKVLLNSYILQPHSERNMKKELGHNLLVILGAIAYVVLYWRAGMGINALLFSILLCAALLQLHPEFKERKYWYLVPAGVMLSALAVVIQHSAMAMVTHVLSIIILLGLAQAREVRFVGLAIALALSGILAVPYNWWKSIENGAQGYWKKTLTWAYRSILPLVVLLIFFVIYYNASKAFSGAIDAIFKNIPQWEPLPQTGAFIMGLLIFSLLAWPSMWADWFDRMEKKFPLTLERRRWRIQRTFSTLALKNHYYSALITLALANLLLLGLNVSDLSQVFKAQSERSAPELSDFVHEGTYLLIVALLLAMLLVAYFFQGNLQFLKDKGQLRTLAMIWLVQNGILALMVMLRNLEYVTEFGLAYLRIGVFWFLILVGLGLASLWGMLYKRHTIVALLTRNTWYWYTSLLIGSFVPWDEAITAYNLSRQGTIDTLFLGYEVSDKNLNQLEARYDFLVKNGSLQADELDRYLEKKRASRKARFNSTDWRGWNWKDWSQNRAGL
jgi:hypothetical protein